MIDTEYRVVGKTGIKISCLGFGTLPFGTDADEETSAKLFHRCREEGINFFDTANSYGNGRSEEILGKLIADCRNEIILSSKVFFPTGKEINDRGLSRRHIFSAIEGNLRRLRTDRLDFYFLHYFDPETAMDETLRALDDLVHQGKILYAAVSNWAAWQIAKALGISAHEGFVRFECLQPMYSLLKRQVEVEILPLALSEEVGVVTYAPTASGLLSGKYAGKARPERGRLVNKELYMKRYGDPVYEEIAERFVAHARERGVHPASLAVAWVMSHPAVTAPLLGARNLEQLEDSLGALKIQMTPEWRAKISAFSIEPPLPTDRSEEKR